MTTIDKENIQKAYEAVRDDSSETTWITLSFNGNEIVNDRSGSDYSEFTDQFSEDDRKFGYVRIMTGDEMSKRAKFALITWVGRNINAIKRAKLSVDKSLVKTVIKNFAAEILAEEPADIALETVTEILKKAGGANYGTGVAK